MDALEQLIGLFVAAIALAAAARRVGAPYPVFLAIGGAVLAATPIDISFTLPPELVLALFVAPVLLDAAYDTSLRDLRDNWAPVGGLVVMAVLLTTAAVAVVVHALVPAVPWGAAIALGAIVAPPDAVAASTVLRPLNPPQRILTVLEGESLLNDASALLIYRLAVGAVASDGFSTATIGPAFLLAVFGSLLAGPALGWLAARLFERIEHVPTAIIMQFVSTFGVWIFAERVGLSAVLTMVSFAVTVAQIAPARTPARIRIPTNAVWETVVFAINALAFIFIGLQMGPVLAHLDPGQRGPYLGVAAAVLATAVAVRPAWHMCFNAAMRRRHRRDGFKPPRPMLRPTVGSGVVVSWAGMRGIVSLAAALALPPSFPYRDLVLLSAYAVVIGTLLIQGLTLKPLLRSLALDDGDPVSREAKKARACAWKAVETYLDQEPSRAADVVRQELAAHLAPDSGPVEEQARRARHGDLHLQAVHAARRAVLALRDTGDIGDDAFHRVEEDLDWLELAQGNAGEA